MQTEKKRGGRFRPAGIECNDDTVVARLAERAGHRYLSRTLALYFRVPTEPMTERLKRLAEAGRVRGMHVGGHWHFYIPGPEDLAAEQRMRDRQHSAPAWSSLATLKIWHPGDPEPA